MRSLLTALVWLTAASCVVGQPSLPKSMGTIPIGGPGGWDCLTVDAANHLLYVSHSTHVPVIDLSQNKVVKDILNTPRVHGIAIAQDIGRGFISNGGDSSVTVFDLKSDSTVANVKVTGRNPDAILYDPFTRRVFTFNGGSANATVIDAKSTKVIGTITLDGKPEFAASDFKGRVFVNIEDKSMLTVIDPKEMKVLSRWPLAPLEEPSAMAIDRKNRRLFVGGRNNLLAVIDADSGKVIMTLPIGTGVDGAEFDSQAGLIYSSNGDGTMTVIKEEGPTKFSVVGNVKTERGARTMALDESTHRLYLSVGTRPDSTGVSKDDFRILMYQQ